MRQDLSVVTPAPYALHWFRRDLRLAGNAALREGWRRFDGRVVGLFCLDQTFLSRPDFSERRFAFFLRTLTALREEMQALGGDLLVIDSPPAVAFSRLMDALGNGPALVTFNRDYEPFASTRDQAIGSLLVARGIEYGTFRDHLLLEPNELSKGTGGHYSVYSPFARAWRARAAGGDIRSRIALHRSGLDYLARRVAGHCEAKWFRLRWSELWRPGVTPPADVLEAFTERCERRLGGFPLPKAGSVAAFAALQALAPRLATYHSTRDRLDDPHGTSGLSIYFKNGSLVPTQAMAYLGLDPEQDPAEGAGKYLSELIWREFYFAILAHVPEVESLEFQVNCRGLPWEHSDLRFDAWQQGRTGFPVVDAAMRQLAATGTMHNRARMIVASFLTKDLLLDWRLGERTFMAALLDGDLAANNGGWQWAASTGCDAQPYFRVFNPTLQGLRFDPTGAYVLRWLPELAPLRSKGPKGAKDIHAPPDPERLGYVRPIVDHQRQRQKALALFKGHLQPG